MRLVVVAFLALAAVAAAPAHAVPTQPPEPVEDVADATQVASHGGTTCAIRKTGQVICWGGYAGKFGRDELEAQPLPEPVPGITDARHVAVGTLRACATRATGAVVCWDSAPPKPVRGLADARSVAVGTDHACAVRKSGQVACWGDNQRGQLGTAGEPARTDAAVAVTGLTDVVDLAAHGDRTCAARRNGTVLCWGTEDDYINDCAGDASRAPAAASIRGTRVALGSWTQCAIDDGALDCRVRCATPRNTRLDQVRAITARFHTICALHATGRISCVGETSRWGDWARRDDDDPALVIPDITTATSVTADPEGGCAVLKSGAVWCWGRDRR